MKNALWLTPATLALAGGAFAQTTNPHPFSVRGGFSYFPGSAARQATAANGYTLGLGYDLPFKVGGGAASKVSFDIDYDAHTGHGNNFKTTAFQLVYRSPFGADVPGSGMASKLYFGIGLGLFRSTDSLPTQTTVNNGSGVTTITTQSSNTKNTFGGSLLVGTWIANNTSLELYYRMVGSFDGVRADTLGLSIGVHF